MGHQNAYLITEVFNGGARVGTSEKIAFVVGLFCGIVLFSAIFRIAQAQPRVVFEKEAIDNGAGEYYINEEDKKTFRWMGRLPSRVQQ